MPAVSDSSAITENVVLWTFQRNISESVPVTESVNAQIDLGFLKVYFNNDNLNDIPNLQINGIELFDQAGRGLQTFQLARADGLKLVNAQYGMKTITVDGFIAAATRALFETARDTLLKLVEPQEAKLRFSQAGADRNYTCTLSNVVWNEKPGGGFATFSLQFACSDPFGYDTTATTDLNASAITTTSSTKTFTAVGGTYKTPPIITATLASGTGLTGGVSISDHSGNLITIYRSWSANDVLVINSITKAVTVNGTTVDYGGVFPVLMPGDTAISYSDNFTTRSLTLSMTHFNRYK